MMTGNILFDVVMMYLVRRLPYNVCGCVYKLDVNQTYVAQKMSALVCGNTATNTVSSLCTVPGTLVKGVLQKP